MNTKKNKTIQNTKRKENTMGIGDWGLGPIPNPQSPIPKGDCIMLYNIFIVILIGKHNII